MASLGLKGPARTQTVGFRYDGLAFWICQWYADLKDDSLTAWEQFLGCAASLGLDREPRFSRVHALRPTEQ